MDILHIYAITSGSAGSYVHKIYRTLQEKFSQEVIVNYHYPYNYGKKKFYRFSELSNPNIIHRINKVRLIVRFFEMLFGLIYSLFFILIKKPKIINYSLTSQINIEYIFLFFVSKFSNSKLYITVHDVLPFQTTYTNQQIDIQKRKSFFILADKLIVHNQNSIDDLINHYNIDINKIITYTFPIMDISDCYEDNIIKNDIEQYFQEDKITFSFVGHLRKEKGIEVLLETWDKIHNNPLFSNVQLLIAGNIPKGFNYNFSNKPNIIIINRFLSDFEYKKVIELSNCIILPYTKGTNTGIPSTVLSLKTKLITSDIDMFNNQSFIDKNFMFKNSNSDSLIEVMKKIIENKDYDFSKIQNYDLQFKKNIQDVFKNEVNNAKIR